MKKYLLLILTMLSVSIGTWAQDPDPATSGKFGASGNSEWELTGTSPNQTLTLTFNDANDKPLKAVVYEWGTSWEAICSATGITKVVVNTGSGVTLSGGADSPLAVLNDYYKAIPLLDLSAASINIVETYSGSGIYTIPMANGSNQSFNNIIVPSTYSNGLGKLKVSNIYNWQSYATVNTYQVSGTTVNAVFNTTSDKYATLSSISSAATKLKLANNVEGAIDLSSVLEADNILDLTNVTTEASYNSEEPPACTNSITVGSGVKAVCLTTGVKSRVTGTDAANVTVVDPVVSCTASELSEKLNALANNGVTPTSITITSGELSAADITSLDIEGLTRINLQEATIASGANINSLTIPSTLQALTLPKSATPESAIDATLLTKVKNASSLMYVYAPYSGTQDKDQMVADYVWANKPGGLWQAMENESRLCTAVYVKVASDVANGVRLNEDDAKFGNHSINASSENDYPWQYIDLSATFFGVEATNANTAPHDKSYRIILPDNLTGDNMAIFASKPVTDEAYDNPDRGYRGNIAAVYSYKGTTLNLMEITDASYHTNALADSRIVRSGTEEVKVISGSNGGTTFSKFGPNLLEALNSADDTPGDNTTNHITKVSISVGDGIYTAADTKVSSATTFAFDNDNLTNLDLSYTNNSDVTIDVSGCAGLTNFQMNEATVAAVNANGITTLATVSLGHTTVGSAGVGDVNLSGTSLATQLEVDLANIAGTLNISGTSATSYDLTQLTAKSVNASNTNSLKSLNINGITLNGMTGSGSDAITAENIASRTGTVEVTRDEGDDYSNLTITTASSTEFTTDRIVPKLSEITDENKKYTLTAIEPSHVEISAAGNLLNSTVPTALTTYNEAQDPQEDNTVANIEILHVTGTLTAEDITYIQTSLTGLKLLDLSDCTFDTNVSVTNITSSTIPTSVAIVLPGTTNDEADKIADVKDLVDDGYECVAYYTTKTTEVKNMNIYATNGTVGNLEANAPDLINGQSCITFLPRYANTTVGSSEHQYPEVTPSFLTGLQTFVNGANGGGGVGCVDLTWINISKLGVDFSGLNTYHLVIPQNTTAATVTRNGINYDNDFTKEDDGSTYSSTDTYKYYKYHANTYAVSTYKGTTSPYATQAYFDGESYQYGSGYGQINKTATLTYLRTTGRLGTAYGYMPDLLKDADIITIAGTLDSEDIAQSEYTTSLSDFTNPYIDLTHAQFASTGENPVSNGTWTSFSNSRVKDIAMPYDYSTTLAGLPTVGACDNLQGIASLVKSDDVLSEPTKKSTLVYQSYKEGGMEGMLPMLHALNLIEKQYRITSLTLGGPVLAKDIADRVDGIDANGHLWTLITNGCITGLQQAGTQGGSLSGYAAIESWDFSKATLPTYTAEPDVASTNQSYRFDNTTHTYATSESSTDGFSYQNDLAYTYLGIASSTGLTGAILPTDNSVWRIADNALNNCKGLVNAELHIPYNYQYIGNGAFLDTYIEHITTTDAAGNLIDNGANTYTLSANVKEIGNQPTPADASLGANQTVFPQNRPVYDMYILATDVPKCYKGAFPANMLYGWGGFRGGDFPYCRDKYVNGSNYYCVLRFPYQGSMGDSEYAEMKKMYTDVNKVYTKKEQTGAVDANGDVIVWPTFSELRRAYNQATNGMTWNDWTTTYDINHEVNGGDQIPTTSQTAGSGSGDYDFTNYEGWHQFTLSQATYVESTTQNAVDREYELAGWYTFCIPYDLTESQVYEWLGVPYSTANYTNKYGDDRIKKSDESIEAGIIDRKLPEIRTLKEVTRTPGNTNVIQLRMSDNLATPETPHGTYNYLAIDNSGSAPVITPTSCGGDASDPIVIKGGYPYYIRPYLLKGEKDNIFNLGKYVMSRYGDKFKQTASCSNHDGTKEYLGAAETDLATLWFAKPYEEHKIWAKYDDDDEGTDAYEYHDKTNSIKYYYTYVGQFWNQNLPSYCYYTMEGTGKWYRFTHAEDPEWQWYAYKCVILCSQEVTTGANEGRSTSGKFRDDSKTNYPNVSVVGTQNDLLDGEFYLGFLNGLDDYVFSSTNSARQCIFTFDDDIMDVGYSSDPTGIESLDGVNILPSNAKVYNMNGQLVGNSVDGLTKGMYIVNGRKVVIK